MNSEAFDNYIKDQVLRAENAPLQNWDAEDTWAKLEQLSTPKTRVLIPWGKIAVAASLLLFIGSTTFMGFQSRNQNQKFSALQEKKEILEQQLEQMELKMQKQTELAQASKTLEAQKPQRIQQAVKKKAIVPILVQQLPILIHYSVTENDRMALHQMKPAIISPIRQARKSIHNSMEIITQPNITKQKKKKFKIRFGKKPDKTAPKVPSYSFFAMN